jgi:hypothetical protein
MCVWTDAKRLQWSCAPSATVTDRLAFVRSLVVSPESRRSATASCIPLVPGARVASDVGTEA